MSLVQEVDAFADWWERFQPTGTPTTYGGPHIGEEPKMFETFGADLELVRQAHARDPHTIWTLIDCDGELYIGAGFHYVNRVGYFITANRWNEDQLQEDILIE